MASGTRPSLGEKPIVESECNWLDGVSLADLPPPYDRSIGHGGSGWRTDRRSARLWRTRRVSLSDILLAETLTFDPERDYGGYGIRSTRQGTAYLAIGNRGVRLKLVNGATLIVGSQRPEELVAILTKSAKNVAG
jgi:hypothetical protein